jgi:endonuclease/exonuclease/phosphatase family metal-dependent hydrolase
MARTLHRSARVLSAIAFVVWSAAVLSLCVSWPIAADEQGERIVTLGTWNVMRLGHGQQKDYEALGEVVKGASFDFLALQEVMTEEGLERLRVSVEAATGARWEVLASHAIGRDSYREMYAFLWNDAVIEYVDGAVVYLDISDRFAREPYSARFRIRDSGLTFVAANVHIVRGDKQSDRTPEIEALAGYWHWMQHDVYADDAARILLMGDFNLKLTHAAWAPLRAVAEPLIVSGATTLSTNAGVYANLYDNVWIPSESQLPIVGRGIFEYPAALEWEHDRARRHVSDHAPIWLKLAPVATPAPATVTQR